MTGTSRRFLLVPLLFSALAAREVIVDYSHHPPLGPVQLLDLPRPVALRRDTTFVCERFATLKAHEEEWDGRIYAIDGCHTLDRADYTRATLLANTYAYARVRFALRTGTRPAYWVPRPALMGAWP